jgi:hypothetical protein
VRLPGSDWPLLAATAGGRLGKVTVAGTHFRAATCTATPGSRAVGFLPSTIPPQQNTGVDMILATLGWALQYTGLVLLFLLSKVPKGFLNIDTRALWLYDCTRNSAPYRALYCSSCLDWKERNIISKSCNLFAA